MATPRRHDPACGLRDTLCQVRWPHCGHFRRQRGLPVAIQRMPPRSHTERAKPHGQRTIHARESASIDAAQRGGSTAVHAR